MKTKLTVKIFAFIMAISLILPLSSMSQTQKDASSYEKEFTLAGTSRAFSVGGSITGASIFTAEENHAATYAETYVNVPADCLLVPDQPPSPGKPYAIVDIYASATEELQLSVDDPGASTLTDATITLYCGPFNPATPAVNRMAYNDDGGTGLWPAFAPGDGVDVAAGTTYYLVISTFSGSANLTGDFVVNVTSGGAVPPSIPLAVWGIVAAVVLILGFATWRFRKQLFAR